jgi:hypothetical protein
MIEFTYQKAVYNGENGYFVTRYINGVYSGKQFGRTKKIAIDRFSD